jgi:hypothetical protein
MLGVGDGNLLSAIEECLVEGDRAPSYGIGGWRVRIPPKVFLTQPNE